MAYKRRRGKSIVPKKQKSYKFKGVDYKSPLEMKMAMLLTQAELDFEYEPENFHVMEGFNFPFDCYERQSNGKGEFKNRGLKKILPTKYTPDFIGDGFIIETKGYANEAFPLRWKLFKKLLTDSEQYTPENLTVYKPQTLAECEETINLIKQKNEQRGN